MQTTRWIDHRSGITVACGVAEQTVRATAIVPLVSHFTVVTINVAAGIRASAVDASSSSISDTVHLQEAADITDIVFLVVVCITARVRVAVATQNDLLITGSNTVEQVGNSRMTIFLRRQSGHVFEVFTRIVSTG